MKVKECVKLRSRERSNGTKSLFLDYFSDWILCRNFVTVKMRKGTLSWTNRGTLPQVTSYRLQGGAL